MFLRCWFSVGIKHSKKMVMPHGMHYVFIASGVQALELNGSMMGQMICTWFEVVCNVVSLCSAHPSLQIYTRLLFCTLSFEKRLEFGHGCMSFRTFFDMCFCTLACWDTMGSFPRTLQSLDILREGRVILYIAKFRQRGGGKGVFVRCQIYTQRDTRCPLSLAKPAPENGPTDHAFGEGLQKQ